MSGIETVIVEHHGLSRIEEDLTELGHFLGEFSNHWSVTVAHCLFITSRVFTSSSVKGVSWFYTLLLCFLQGYGGGVINSFVFTARILPPFFNDTIVITLLLSWFVATLLFSV